MTTILWDIDGVLNPLFATDLIERGFFHVDEGYASWNIDLTHHAAWMRDLSTKADMIWCSSWMNDSNIIATYFMLDNHLDYVDFPTMVDDPDITWKLEAVKNHFAGSDEPIIWLDDEFKGDAYEWAKERPYTLLISCDPAVGWTQKQYEKMLDFIEFHK